MRALGLMVVALFQTIVARVTRGAPRPSWSFAFQVVQRFMRLDWDRTADWDLPRVRDEVSRMPYPRKFVKRVVRREEKLGGVPACIYARPGGGAALFSPDAGIETGRPRPGQS